MLRRAILTIVDGDGLDQLADKSSEHAVRDVTQSTRICNGFQMLSRNIGMQHAQRAAATVSICTYHNGRAALDGES